MSSVRSPGSTRDHIVTAAARLFETQGYAATGINQILRASGAPKGSLYYYFPGGKDELAVEAVQHVGLRVNAAIRAALDGAEDPGQAICAYTRGLAEALRDSSYERAGSIAAVALETAGSNPRLQGACSAVYRQWQDAFRERLSHGGYAAGSAERLAGFVVSSIEGALLLCRLRRSTAPIEDVAEDLELLLGKRAFGAARPLPEPDAPADRPSAASDLPPWRSAPAAGPAMAAAWAGATVPRTPSATVPEAAPSPTPAQWSLTAESAGQRTGGGARADAAYLVTEEPPARQAPSIRRVDRPMRLLIVGASGGTGSHLIEQALAGGHSVTALARDPSSIWVKHERLAVVQGDVRDAERMDQVVSAGIDAVLSALGPGKGSPRNLLMLGTRNLVAAMEHYSVLRLVVLMSASVSDPRDEASRSRGLGPTLRRLAPGNALDDAEAAAAVLRASTLDWVLVRAPRLTDGAHTSFYLTGYLKAGSVHAISRSDVAEFMLKQLTDDEFVHAAPLISY